MPLFGKQERYLGVDIGNSAVKIVEVENVKGKPKLLTYGYAEQENNIVHSNTDDAKQQIVATLKQVQKQARTSSKMAVAALPSYTVFSSIIHLPKMSKKELDAAVQWEAKKFVPMPIEEMVLNWQILESTNAKAIDQNPEEMADMEPTLEELAAEAQKPAKIKTQGKEFNKILLTAAPKDLVTRYVDIFKEAGLELVSIETESFALERSLIGKDPSPIMMIDIGFDATMISVVMDAVPLINRSIDVGGHTITKQLAQSMHVELDQAEQFKRDFGFMHAQEGDSEDKVPNKMEFIASSIINEVNYVLNLYHSQGHGQIEKVILSGGSAWIPNLTNFLSKELGVKVFIGDPWARVMYPVDMKDVLRQVGPRLAVSVGLAMREIH